MTITIIGGSFSHAGRDGIHIEGDTGVHIENVHAFGNGRHNINVVAAAPAERAWHERPSGALALSLLAGVSVEALKRGLGIP